MKPTLRISLGIALTSVLALVSVDASSTPPTFQIKELYSSLDGAVQYVLLEETAGLNGQQHFAGSTLTMTYGGVVKQFTFTADLATDQTAHREVLVATIGSGTFGFGHRPPDFAALPERFLAVNGGTVDFAGVDRLTFSMLPTDGTTALYRDGSSRPASAGLFSPGAVVVEYYNGDLDHYFYTAYGAEIDALDAQRVPGWQRTGARFRVDSQQSGSPPYAPYAVWPVCRFYIPVNEGDSHFYSASPDECAIVRTRFPEFVEESEAAFFVALPDLVTGQCPVIYDTDNGSYNPIRPVFRLWNQRADSNHRYTTDVGVRNLMVARGYAAEGYGPNAVTFCLAGSP